MDRFGIAVLAIFLAIGAAAVQAQSKSNSKSTTKPNQKQASDIPAPDFKKCEALLLKSVVRVQTKSGIGTGFPIGDGTVIVTNDHVIRTLARDNIEEGINVMTTDGTEQKATVLLTMPHRDLAALKVENALQPLSLAEDDQFMYHTPVMVVGHGRGVQNLQNTGMLTNLSEWSKWEVRSSKLLFANDTLLLTTDATIHPGHSGSSLATPDGLIVGAMTFIDVTNAKGNMAVHVSHIRELLEKADPKMKLPKGKLSNVERIRIERMQRTDALQKLAQQKQTKISKNKTIDTTSLNMFFNARNAVNRMNGL